MSKNSLEDKASTSAQATESTPLVGKTVSFITYYANFIHKQFTSNFYNLSTSITDKWVKYIKKTRTK